MKKTKIIWLFLAVLIGVWLASPIWDAVTTPSTPAIAQQVEELKASSAQLVDRQWSRPNAVPTQDDRVEYEQLIATANHLAPPIAAEMAANTEKRLTTERFLRLSDRQYDRKFKFARYVGTKSAVFINEIVFGPTLDGARYHAIRAEEAVEALNGPRDLRVELRYHYAMALVFAGDKPAAVAQLRAVIKEEPKYSLVNDTYMIGGRADAQNDADFCSDFQAVGGDLKRLRRDYTGTNAAQLYPHINIDVMSKHSPC